MWKMTPPPLALNSLIYLFSYVELEKCFDPLVHTVCVGPVGGLPMHFMQFWAIVATLPFWAA